MKPNYDDQPSFYLHCAASWLFQSLDDVVEAGELGKITGLSMRGEVPLNPEFYKRLKRVLLDYLEPVEGQTVGEYRVALRDKRLADEGARDVMAHYSRILDDFLVAVPHYLRQIGRTPRATRWLTDEQLVKVEKITTRDDIPF